ncbi:Serine acetyltransferase [invertebrate metagenome]|uniref:Serine acetyltransferase n=1 Tax=invertebrate metagenome TaxID=1711999 RepID=A0A2H9T4D0_9ZZZZ
MSHSYPLKYYLHEEIAGGLGRKFSWLRVIRRIIKSRESNYLFWFRIANVLNSKNRFLKSIAKSINKHLMRKFGIEIMLGVTIDPGLTLPHPQGIVITKNCIIGKNFTIRQGSTIGVDYKSGKKIIIGNNVDIGANCTVIGSGLHIGDDVVIGAMKFINKDIPSGVTCVNKKPIFYTKN